MSRPTAFPSLVPDVFSYSTKSSEGRLYFERVPPPSARLASDQNRLDAIEHLLDLPDRYRHENWDGEGAEPISEAAIQEAREFLQKLTSWVPLPEVVPEPDGYLGLEWCANKWLLYVVSFNGKGAMSCSGLMGSERVYGTRFMDDGVPADIIRNIARIFR